MSTAPNGWQAPKTDWATTDAVGTADLNRMESNPDAIENGSRTVDPTQAPAGNAGTLRQLLDWFANRFQAITGAANWWTAPATTLAGAKAHADSTAVGVHGSASAATANTLIHRDANGRAKVAAPSAVDDIARKDTVDAVQTNLNNHTGAAAGAHPAAAITYAGSTNLSATTVEAALDELDAEKAGLALNNTFTDGQTIDRVAPGAGGQQMYWLFNQGGANKFRFTLDSAGNLVLQNFTGGAWTTSATFPLAGGVVTGLNAEKLGGETLAQIKDFATVMAMLF